LLLALLARNVFELRRHLGWMEEAAQTAERIAVEIERVAQEEPLFVADHPAFLRGPTGAHRAQIYHYGLRAAVGPPFHERQIDVYPLPPRSEADPRRLALAYPVFRWSPQEGRLVRLRPRSAALPPLLEPDGPDDGARLVPELASSLRVAAPPTSAQRVASTRLIAVAPGNAMVVSSQDAEARTLELPGSFLRLWADLAPGPQLWWLEARDGDGRALASSQPRWFSVPRRAGIEDRRLDR
jgi:hypothetical protein